MAAVPLFLAPVLAVCRWTLFTDGAVRVLLLLPAPAWRDSDGDVFFLVASPGAGNIILGSCRLWRGPDLHALTTGAHCTASIHCCNAYDMRLAHMIAVFFGCPADIIRAVYSTALNPLHRKWNYSFDPVQAWHCVRRAAREPRYDDTAQTVCSQQLPRRCQSPHAGAQSAFCHPRSVPRPGPAPAGSPPPVQNRICLLPLCCLRLSAAPCA